MYNLKVLFVLGVVVACATAQLGAPSKLSGDSLKEAENTLNESLTKLAAGDGPSYTLVKITEAEKQVIAGFKYTYKAELKSSTGDVKKCNIVIIHQGWLENGVEVTFDCDGEEKVVKRHNA